MIEKLLLHFIGYSVFIGVMYGMWKSNARRWSRLARKYSAGEQVPSQDSLCFAKRTKQTVILVGGNVGWNSYKGIVTVGVTSEGILLQLLFPFSIFHAPLLISYRDCSIEPKKWCLFGKSHQYTLTHVSDVQLIIDDDLQHWINTQCASLAVAAN